jgi:hypothetical protein
MTTAIFKSAVLVLIVTLFGCMSPPPPPPKLTVTSPERGTVQSNPGQVTVTGTAVPGSDGAIVAKVTVNGTKAKLADDGSFTATVDVPYGATLIETTAISIDGGKTTDARALQIGERRPIGSNIPKAMTVTASTEVFAKLSAAAGPLVKSMDLMSMLAPMQPMASLGNDLANAKITITRIAFGDVKFTLTPVDGGLQIAVDITALDFAAKAAYGGTFIIDGTTNIGVTADRITIAGTLTVTPAGVAGFTTKLVSPSVKTTNLRLNASGLVGDVLDLLQDNLASTVNKVVTSASEKAMQPLMNAAFGALAGPQRFDVMGNAVEVQASPSTVTFSSAGALVSLDLQVKIDGSESSPGFLFTPNGTPMLDVSSGVKIALADDLLNEMLAEVHALDILKYHLAQDFGVFDTADISLTMPPMISANSPDGTLRLVLGDMRATFSDNGKTLITAAVNAQVDVKIERGTAAEEIVLQLDSAHAVVNVVDGDIMGEDLSDVADTGIAVQVDSLNQFMLTVPVPTVANLTLDNLALRADSGYVVVSGQVH